MPDLRFPSIDGLRAFEAAARLGTFEKAAEELAVTASAVGKRIVAVEELLGTPLFQRGPRLTLTPAGKEYLTHVRAALGLLAAAPQHRRGARRVQRLRVSTPPTFARHILVPELPDFSAAHPEVELEVVLSIPFLDDGGTEADVQVRHGDAAAVGGTVLMPDVVLPMAAPSLLSRLPPLRVPADLAHAPLLRTPLEPWAPWFEAAGLPWPEPDQGPRLLDLGLTLEAALGGQGVALARPSLARTWLDTGALLPLFDVHATPAHQYHLLPYAAGGVAAQFAQWLQQACERIAREALAQLAARRAA
jgi:DNA-binding transcriptional LysR family regulator